MTNPASLSGSVPHTPLPAFAGSEVLRTLLIVLAVLVLVTGVGAAAVAVLIPAPGASATSMLPVALAIFLGCTCVGVLMLGAAAILKLMIAQARDAALAHSSMNGVRASLAAIEEAINTLPQQNMPAVPMVAAPAPEDQAASAQTIDMLSQVRDLLLMSPAQREERGKQHWEQRKVLLRKTVEQHMAAGEWALAEQSVKELFVAAPDDPSVETLARKIEEEQNKRIAAALEAARTKLRHFMSITAWAQADEVVRGLRKQFAAHPDVEAIAAEVAREREAFDRETIQRLFHDVKDATDHKQWRRACEAGEELIRRYPNEKKVEKLKADIATIKENAEAQERREQELLFKDLLKRQRYEEALTVATGVINKYPSSTAAMELNKLLPKVEELIRQAQSSKP